jgi:hypothetical protein
MPAFQCTQCMKTFVDNRIVTLLCPFCHCRVLPCRGALPINPCRFPLLGTQAPPLPLPSAAAPLKYKFIPLTGDNIDFWREYVLAMRLMANHMVITNKRPELVSELKNGWTHAVRGFTLALDAFCSTPKCEVWIAVASFGAISEDNFAQSALDIEMCMTVTTHPDVPFTTHMGIFRSPLRRVGSASRQAFRGLNAFRIPEIVSLMDREWVVGRTAGSISAQFHAYAARKCLQKCQVSGTKRYMITAPLRKMMLIMQQVFRAADVGFDQESCTVIIGDKRFTLKPVVLKKCEWLTRVICLHDPGTPKVAIDLHALANWSGGNASSRALNS